MDISYLFLLGIFVASQAFFYLFHLKLELKAKDFEIVDKTTSSVFSILNDFHLKLKNNILLLLEVYFCFAKRSYPQRCFDVTQRCKTRR